MPTYGRYETGPELYRAAATFISTATPSESARPCVVKVFQPDPVFVSAEQIQTRVAAFLNAARIQQKVAGSGASHWAPIHDLGTTPGGAFYVTGQYPLSAQKLISGMVRPTPDNLLALGEGVLKGLVELKRSASRSHGNLKPSNILLDPGKGGIGMGVFLTDPADSAHAASESGDLYALGRVLYQLVMLQPVKGTSSWPIATSPAWTQLGRKANRWRELCNRLLHPSPEEGLLTLESVSYEIAALGGGMGRPRTARGVMIVAGVVVVVGVGGFFIRRGWHELRNAVAMNTGPGRQAPVEVPVAVSPPPAPVVPPVVVVTTMPAPQPKPPAPIPEAPDPTKVAAEQAEKARRVEEQRHIADLLDSAKSHQAKEEYAQSLANLEEILKLSPQNVEARQMRDAVSAATAAMALKQRMARDKALADWKAGIAAPAIHADVLLGAWSSAVRKQTADLSDPDPAVKARLDELRSALEDLERAMPEPQGLREPFLSVVTKKRAELMGVAAKSGAADGVAAGLKATHDLLAQQYTSILTKQKTAQQVADLLAAANTQKGNAEYSKALSALDELAKLSPQNADAAHLRSDIAAAMASPQYKQKLFAKDIGRLEDSLKPKIAATGYTADLHARLSQALEQLHFDDAAGQDLVKQSQAFVDGKTAAAGFAEYLARALETPQQRTARLAQEAKVNAARLAQEAQAKAAMERKGKIDALLAAARAANAKEDGEKALALVNQILGLDPNNVEGLAIKQKIAGYEKKARARQWIADAKAAADGIADATTRSTAYAPIADVQADAGDFTGALATADAISDKAFVIPGRKASVYARIAGDQAHAGDIEGAKHTVDLITIASTKADAYQEIAVVQVDALDVASARLTVKGIEDAARRHRAMTRVDIAEAQARAAAGDVAGAKKAADAIAESLSRSEAYTSLARSRLKAGDKPGAIDALALAQDAAPGIANATLRLARYLLIFQAEMDAGNLDGAKQAIGSAQKAASAVDDPESHVSEHVRLVTAQARIDVEGARRAADTIGLGLLKDEAYAGIERTVLETTGDQAVAKSLAEAISAPAFKARAFARLSAAQAKAGSALAEDSFVRAKQAAAAVPRELVRCTVYRNIAEILLDAGDKAKGAQAIGLAKAAALSIADSNEKDLALNYVAEMQAGMGDIAGARQTADILAIAEEKTSTYRAIARAQAQGGDVNGVAAWAKAETDPLLQVHVLIGGAEGLLAAPAPQH